MSSIAGRRPGAAPAAGSGRRLRVVDATVDALLSALPAALAGDGPALAPVDRSEASIGASREHERTFRTDQPLERDDVAVVLATSGSTGEPKAALLSASALLHSARATLERLGGPGGWTLALPVSRIAGLQVLVRSLLAGTHPVPVARPFTAEAFCAATARLLSRDESRRYTALVPTQLVRLLDAGPSAIDALRSYDAILVGGAAAPATLLDRARSAGIAVVTTYGMTETCGGCVYDGVPLDGVRIALDDRDGSGQGRIRIGGPVVFAGYRLRPDLTAQALVDGWHVTDDVGRWTTDGRLEVLRRIDDVVISGGVNVPLPAVDQAVGSFPGVAEAAAVGVPDPEWGARIVAYVVLQPGAPVPALADVRAHVAAHHPVAYAPRELIVVDALPVLSSGKLDRAALVAAASGRSDRVG
ncbi:MAG TPA: o-succinylbenzoate--CoA ligase [Actinopolymorphaceae bacterium]